MPKRELLQKWEPSIRPSSTEDLQRFAWAEQRSKSRKEAQREVLKRDEGAGMRTAERAEERSAFMKNLGREVLKRRQEQTREALDIPKPPKRKERQFDYAEDVRPLSNARVTGMGTSSYVRPIPRKGWGPMRGYRYKYPIRPAGRR